MTIPFPPLNKWKATDKHFPPNERIYILNRNGIQWEIAPQYSPSKKYIGSILVIWDEKRPGAYVWARKNGSAMDQTPPTRSGERFIERYVFKNPTMACNMANRLHKEWFSKWE